MAATVVAVAAVSGLALAGWAGLAVVATVTAVLILLEVRGLAPRPAAAATRKARESDTSTVRSVTGYSQRRFQVTSGISSRSFYEGDLRPALEHLLAARLAERRGINLYTDPEAARRAFIRTRADELLWRWVDPATARAGQTAAGEEHGIPPRTLARLIDRLEHL